MNKKHKLILFILLLTLIIILLFNFSKERLKIYYDKDASLKITTVDIDKNINNKKTENNDKNNRINENIKTDNDEIDINSLFIAIPEKLLKRDSEITLTPTEGYIITTSILSNKKDKIVYSEISDCIGELNKYGAEKGKCYLQYNIFVKDINSDIVNKIYSIPQNKVSLLKSLLFSEVHAGGCRLAYFPIAWSKNDQKIILQWGNPTNCGSGGRPIYSTYTINPSGGKMQNLSTDNPIFFDNYNKVIYTDNSSKSPHFCGPGGSFNTGRIVLTDIETNKTTIIDEEDNLHYTIDKLDDEQEILTYYTNKVKEVDGCAEIDSFKIKREMKIN